MSTNELKIFVEYRSFQTLNRSFHPGLVSEVCEISYTFILATSYHNTLSILTSISELKLFVEYHSIQMLNKSFHLGLIYVKFDINLFWQLLTETLSLIMIISQLEIYLEYHTIQILNRIFHPGLVTELCEIPYTFIPIETLLLLECR